MNPAGTDGHPSADRDTRPATDEEHRRHLLRAIELAQEGSARGDGGPFGAVVVLGGQVVGEGWNQVVVTNDPTAHAEIVAVRRACAELGSFQLTGAHVYASCEPCPMCLGALYWARPAQIHYAATREHAAEVGFDDSFIYDELGMSPTDRRLPVRRHDLPEAARVMRQWAEDPDRATY